MPTYLKPVLLIPPLLTLLLYIVLGAVGFPSAAHMWLAILEVIIFFPGALLVVKLFTHIGVFLLLMVAGNEAAARLAQSIAAEGIAGPGLTLWITYPIFISLKLFGIFSVYKAVSRSSSRPTN